MDCIVKKTVSLAAGTVMGITEEVYTGPQPTYSGQRRTLVKVIGPSYTEKGWLQLEVLESAGVNALPVGVVIVRPIANLMDGNDLTEEFQSYKLGGPLAHNLGAAGGYLVGKKHSEGGIKGFNKATGQPLEVEGGEVIITAPAVQDSATREFEGEQLTNREILSKINVSGGGIAFADGGHIDSCRCSGKAFKYGGETLTDYQIVERINKG